MMEDKRAQRTKQAILASFQEMICQMESQEITVKELTERAGINRKTFYRHFETLEDLFDWTLDGLVEAYMTEMRKLPVPVDIREQTRVFFEFYCYQPAYVERLMCVESYSIYCDRLQRKAIEQNKKRYHPNQDLPLGEQELLVSFLVSSSLGLYRQWVWDKKQVPVERLIQLGCELITNGYWAFNRIGNNRDFGKNR